MRPRGLLASCWFLLATVCVASRLAVAAVFVGEEHAVGVAFREEAGLLEWDGGADASAFADHADAAFGRTIVMRAAVEQHAAVARRAFLFR